MMAGKLMMKSASGFTMIEMVIVLVMIGILTASLAPLLLRQHTSSMEERDRVALEDAKTAIISYATTFGGIPNPNSAVAAISGVMPRVEAFGVNNWGAFGSSGLANPLQYFQMDVNDNLTSSCTNNMASGVPCATPGALVTGGNRVVFCQAVNAAMSAVPAAPFVCQDYAGDHTTVACPATSAVPAAFVLYSTGNDRIPNQENATSANRIYENDKRGINNSPDNTAPGATRDHYDDQVMSYPLSAFARDCREKMGVTPEVMNCAAGEKYVGSIQNNLAASSVSYTFTAASSVIPANFTLYHNTCHAASNVLTTEVLIAASVVQISPTLTTLDANNDGRVDIFIGASGVTYAVTAQ